MEGEFMYKITFRSERCKGCGNCINACPKNIITLSNNLNENGYYCAEIDIDEATKCIGCASCAKMCPDSVITIEKDDE